MEWLGKLLITEMFLTGRKYFVSETLLEVQIGKLDDASSEKVSSQGLKDLWRHEVTGPVVFSLVTATGTRLN